MFRCLSLSSLLLLAACARPASEVTLPSLGAVTLDTTQGIPVEPYQGALNCDAMPDAGVQFVDATESWNLGEFGEQVTGNRLAVADLDGDGYPDLVVHAVTSNKREVADAGTRIVRMLMNRPTPDGQRRQFVDATDWGLFQVRDEQTTDKRSAQLVAFGDVDNDGDLDAFSGTYVDPTKPTTDPGDRSEILLNDGTGHFTLAPPTDSRPTATQLWPTTGATFTDVDRDGKLDLFVGFFYEYYGRTYNGIQAQLYKGLGTGEFLFDTDAAGLHTDSNGFAAGTNSRPAYGVTACDLDDDGSPELLVSAYGRQWNLLYQNDGTGHFTEVGQASGFAGDSDANYQDNEFFRCWCVQYPSDSRCANVTPPDVQCPNPAGANWGAGTDDQPWRNNGNTFTTFCADIDGDGKNDLYNAEIHHWWAGEGSDSSQLLKNTSSGGALSFDRPGNAATGMAWPHLGLDWNEGGLMASGGDFDNDGRMDVVVAASDYPAQYSLLFLQQPDGTFRESGEAAGLHHPCASGLAVADFDRDGDLDVIVGSGTARDCRQLWSKNEVHLYENQGAPGKSVELKLDGDGTTANRSAIGAKVTVTAGGRTFTREVQSSYGHMAIENDMVVHVGLGACPAADSVTVRWPDAQGTTGSWTRVPAGTPVELKMGDPRMYRAMK